MPVHPRISVHSLCFGAASLTQACDHWRALGVQRVGMLDSLVCTDPQAVRAAMDRDGFRIETIAHPLVSGHLSRDTATWAVPRASLSRLIEAAALLEARSIYLVTGGHGDLIWEEAAETFAAIIAPCVTEARRAGVQLAVENCTPLHADIHIAHTVADTVRLAEIADIGVVIDVFAGWTEAGLAASVEQAVPRLCLVQVSDYVYGDRALPARAVPGDGVIPLERIIRWILAAGYTGNFDIELLGPRIDGEGHRAAAARAIAYLGAMLERLGA